MKKLGKITFLSLFIFALSSGLLFAQTITWRFASTWTPAINIIESDRYFAKLVGELSGGRLVIRVHSAGELVPTPGVFDAVAKGTVEIGGDWPGYWGGKNSAFDLLGSFPMTFSQYDYVNWYYHGGGRAIYNEMYGKFNMLYFMTSVLPMESGVRSRVPIKSLADFKGKKLRMAGRVQGHILKRLGGAQVMLPGGEIYQALQLGTIDGAEFSSPSIDWGMGFAEVTKFNVGPGWHQPASMIGVMINRDAWAKLPADLKLIVEYAASATTAYMSSWFENGNVEALEKFKKAGTQVFKLTPEELKTLEGYAWEFLLEESAKNPDYHKVALSMFQYFKDFRVARDMQEPFSQGRNPFTLPALPGLK